MLCQKIPHALKYRISKPLSTSSGISVTKVIPEKHYVNNNEPDSNIIQGSCLNPMQYHLSFPNYLTSSLSPSNCPRPMT